MRRLLRAFIVSLLIGAGGIVHGQEIPVVPAIRSVGFLEDDAIGMPSLTDTGASGLSRLGEMFVRFGASVRRVAADEPIAVDIELLVVIGPARSLPITTTAYVWDFLSRGGHLLLALDPNGHSGVSTERSDSGLNQLLARDYGIRFADDLLIESWFANETLSAVSSSWSDAMPEDFVAHPVVAPLLTYDLPVRYWGGRSLFVEALTGNAATSALIYAESPYGETGRLDLRSGDQAQYTFNIDQDTQGRLLLGALARRPATGSRVAVLGDSEIFRNQFGLARIVTQQSLPRYPGDQLLVERLVHWLIGLPLETWPTLPPEFTPIVVDGQDDDWLPGAALIGLGEVSSGTVRAAIDDQFLYVSIAPPEGISAPDLTAQLSFPQEAGTSVLQVEGGALVDLANPGVPIADSTVAVSHNMELRVPLRVASVVLNQVCIGHASTADRTVCTAAPVEATTLGTLAPVIQYGVPGPAAVPREDMNVRTGPGLEYEAIELLRDRPPLRVLGRSENGEWIRVDSGRTSGWAFRQLLNLNVGLDLLPVLE